MIAEIGLYVRSHMSESQKRKARGLRAFCKAAMPWMLDAFWECTVNVARKSRFRQQEHLKVHVGCGNISLKGFVNLDIRRTKAVDVVYDLCILDLFKGNVDLLFSHAFFEHLYRMQRGPHLKSAYCALSPEGRICYIGIPDFERVASLYLSKGPGTDGPVLDLTNAYRYTHGMPELTPQLHKSLFDSRELKNLLVEGGFQSFAIFRYAYTTDANPVPVNLGFYAAKNLVSSDDLQSGCIEFLRGFPETVLMETLEFID